MLGLDSEGQVFRDRFLIADIHMTTDFPTERWFWFDPPFHRNQSVLLHRQADNVWRVDFQLGWDADPEQEKKPENILPRLRAMLGADAQFDIEWASVYTFACLRMERFRHGRVLFAGDSAHGVSAGSARAARTAACRMPRTLRGSSSGRAAVRQGAGCAARQLRRRARIRGRREHPQLDARHRLHHAEERHQPPVPRCGAATC